MPPRHRTTSPDSDPQPERSPAKDSLEHFERFCYRLKLPDSLAPFRLEAYELDALRDYFEHGALEHLWLWPTGLGKSTLLGALILHHGTYVRVNPRVVILGGLGNHGKHTLRYAAWFISQSPSLRRWWVAQEYGMGRIKSLIEEDSFGVIEISSAGRRVGGRGGSSQEGEAPSLVVVEELHRHEDNGAAVRTLTSKVQKRTIGAHRVRIVHATTAGDSLDSPLGRILKRATSDRAKVKRDGYHMRAEDPDGDVVVHEWAVPPEVEPPSPETTGAELDAYISHVKRANPASFVVPANLRRSWKASAAEPWVFQRQHANQWVTQDQTAISRVGWMAGRKPAIEIPAGAGPVFVGLDTATSFATTAIGPVWVNPRTGRPRTAGGVILSSEQRGTKRRLRDVIDVLEVMRERWPDLRVVFDRNIGGGLIAEQMEEDHGLTVIDHGQGVPMEIASMAFGEAVEQGTFEHDDTPAVTAQVLAAVAKWTFYGRRWRLSQPRSKDPIDMAIALAMAFNAARQDEPKPLDPNDFRIEQL